jgi:hypothetical protein
MAGERVYEMLWDCSFCGARKLLGKSQKFCPQCGAPQDPATRYFPADEDKVEATGYRYEGADKICPACQSPNGALAQFCGRCGAGLSDAKEASRLSDQVRAEDAKFAESLSLRKREEEERRAPVTPVPAAAPKRRFPAWMALAILGLVGFLLAALFWTRAETVVVSGHYWRQEIRIDRFVSVAESAWCDQMPLGAYGVSSHSEVRSHRQVPDGQDCYLRRIDRGDGTFVEREECQPRYRSEPIYDQRCDYRINRWVPARTAVAEGYDLNPRWPETGITGRACLGLGCEREGPRVADYELLLKNPATGKEYRCPLPVERWRAAGVENRWSLDVGAVDGRARCGTLKPVQQR